MATEITREQKGMNVLILSKLDTPRLLAGNRKMPFQLEYRWLSNEDDQTSVKGNEFTFWTAKEAKRMIKNGLFAEVNLF